MPSDLPDVTRDEDINRIEDFEELEKTVVGGNPGALNTLVLLKQGLSDEGYRQCVRDLAAEGAKGELLYLRQRDIFIRASEEEWPFRVTAP